jgi:FkbM family methyltransferase
MLVSYAQNREDLYLYALLGDGPGFYVDVGANHPTVHSVTRFFYERGWHGINIEPNAQLAQELSIHRPRDTNLNLGISDHSGVMTLRVFTDADGLSTFEPHLMAQHESANPRFEDRPVNVERLASVLAQHDVEVIDFMKVDTEGHEMSVLEGNDWSRFRPRCLVIEGGSHDSYIPYLLGRGYQKEFFDGLNFYFVAEECSSEITIMKYAERVLSQAIMPGALAEQISSLEAQVSSRDSRPPDAESAGRTHLDSVSEATEEALDPEAVDRTQVRWLSPKRRVRRWLSHRHWSAWADRLHVRKQS